jgi:16S rRNA (guanine527-N7)-methyltransferase
MSPAFLDGLKRGVAALSLPVGEETFARLERFAERLLAWNAKVSLTSVTEPGELAEKHVVDSLALLRVLGEARTVLDIGSGAGLPGMVLACARPDVEVTCCDSVGKKVAFVKAISAELRLRVRGVVSRAGGRPEQEGLPRADLVVSRALADPESWLPLGVHYLAPGGRLVAMLGREVDEERLLEIAARSGLVLERLDRFELPLSRSQRALAVFRLAGDVPRGT